MRVFRRRFSVILGALVALSACTYSGGGGSGPGPHPVLPPDNVTLLGLGQAPKWNNAPVGQTFTPNLYAVYSNGSYWDVTQSASWASLGPGGSTVSNTSPTTGDITIGAGHTVIRATYGGFTKDYDIWDSTTPGPSTGPVSRLWVDPWHNGLLESAFSPWDTQFTALAYHDDASQMDNSADEDVTDLAAWTSDNPAVAIVSNAPGSRGLATSLGVAGTAKITATLGTLTSSGFWFLFDGLTAWITPASQPSYTFGQPFLFAAARDTDLATFTESDVTSTAVWHSDNEAVATVSATGQITAVGPGTCNVWATYGTHTSNLLQIRL